jgi:hypothetical protein
MRSRVVVSARIILYINGKRIGRITGFQFSSATNRKPAYGLDSSTPYELIPMTTRITGAVDVIRTVGDGGIEGPGIVASNKDIIREKYFSIMLLDRATDKIIFQADQCSVLQQNWSVPLKGIVQGSFQFEALSWNNEVKSVKR